MGRLLENRPRTASDFIEVVNILQLCELDVTLARYDAVVVSKVKVHCHRGANLQRPYCQELILLNQDLLFDL